MRRQVLSIFIFVLCVAGVATVSAQNRYRNVYSRADVENFVRNLEASSDLFTRDFQNAGASNTERRIVSRFETAVDRLRNRFNSTNTWWQSRNEVQGMMSEARQVNVLMNNERYARSLERQWRALRRDINKLADTFELQELQGGGGGRGVYPPGGGGAGTRPPSWAVGTWYWVEGPDRSFSIDANGSVREHTGSFGEGYWQRNSIFLNGISSTVTRTSTGIRTYNTVTGETSNYTRSGYGSGGGEGTTSRPPDWALGTWVWVQGPGRQFTIERSGRVIENIEGRISYGTYYNEVMTLNGNPSTVSRTRNGIRTVNQATGEISDYVRR